MGLAAGSLIGSWLEFLLLRRKVARMAARPRLGGGTLGRLLIAATASLAASPVLVRLVPEGSGSLARLLVIGGGTGAVYLLVTWLLRVPECRQLVAGLDPRRRPT